MAAEVPQLSPAFDARVRRRVRPLRLSATGRVVIAIYIVAAAATAVWLMRDLPAMWIVAMWIVTAVLIGVPVAMGASAYGRRLAVGE